ncbi:hypothetical protein B566_EDAN001878 [Ephemera danica]|nr:hypothetical protein B566_EDAN001878 [Ephemera danica]
MSMENKVGIEMRDCRQVVGEKVVAKLNYTKAVVVAPSYFFFTTSGEPILRLKTPLQNMRHVSFTEDRLGEDAIVPEHERDAMF